MEVTRGALAAAGRRGLLRAATGRPVRVAQMFKSTAARASAASSVDDVPLHRLETHLGDCTAAALERQNRVYPESNIPVEGDDFDAPGFYDQVYGTNCENVVGFLPLPVGVVADLVVNDSSFNVPLATTEGALIASANRGARAIALSGGCRARVLRDSMTRAPVLAFDSIVQASQFASEVTKPEFLQRMQEWFASTTNFGKLKGVEPTVAGRHVYLRFSATTGDAMGMNMVGKGVNVIVEQLLGEFPDASLVSLSSNMCTDKKPSAMNWVSGRGKSVVCEVTLPRQVVQQVLKTDIEPLVQLNITKNLIGSALAGSIGGNNAHAANLVTAVFLATGQDPAQNVESSNCLVTMEARGEDSLYVSVTMPSIEVGTVGGGTSLPVQRDCLRQLGIAGASRENPGENARSLAEIVAATVLAGELSLNAALTSNHLISAHMDLNRKK